MGGVLPSNLTIHDFSQSTELTPINSMYKYMEIDFGDIDESVVQQVFSSYSGQQICNIYPSDWSAAQESPIYETYMSGYNMVIRNPFMYTPVENTLIYGDTYTGYYIKRFAINMESQQAEYWDNNGNKSAMPVRIMAFSLIGVYFSNRIDFGGQPTIFPNMKIVLCKEYPG